MHALVISPFVRKELQLTFYENETVSLLHGRLSREGEHIEFHPQYLNNPETVTSTAESENDKNQHVDLSAQQIFFISLSIHKRKWIPG